MPQRSVVWSFGVERVCTVHWFQTHPDTIQTPSIRILESPSNLIEPSVDSQLSGLGLAKNWKMFWHVLTTTRYNPAPTFHLFTARSVQTRLSGYTRGSAMFQKSNISCFHVGRLCLLHVGPVGFFDDLKLVDYLGINLDLIEIQIYIGNYSTCPECSEYRI